VIPFAALCGAQLVGRVVPPIERTGKVAEVLPQDPQAQLNYGNALHKEALTSPELNEEARRTRIEEAKRKYEFAISRKPDFAEAEFWLGNAWSDLGEFDLAIQHYERSLLLDPKNGKCESHLAGLLVSKGLRAEARRRYEHSLSHGLLTQPDLQIAHKELADILSGAGEYDSAIAHYEQALRIQPDFKEARDNLSFARSLAGH
jgi:tetratricopeptide (TPR) repeat protein